MPLFENTLQDLRYGARGLVKNPGITAVAALSLALGIGANTAIFSLIDTVLVKTLPVRNPQELMLLTDPTSYGVSIGSQGPERSNLSYGEYEHIRDGQQVFQEMFASESALERVSGTVDNGSPEDIHPRLVTGTFFEVLGVPPMLGRGFTAGDDKAPHNAPYAVISYAWWEKRFGRSPDALGKVIRLGKASLTIIGVMPPGFFGETVGQSPDFWVPMMMEPDVKPGRDWLHDDESKITRVMWLQVMGRAKPGVTLKQAQANISVVFQQVLNAYQVPGLSPEQRKNQLEQRLKLHPGDKGANTLSDDFGQPLVVLMTVVGMVLLIACANIANLLLARAAGRQKEIAVRLAMGAGRVRLGLQLLTESLLLAAIGAGLGLLLSMWGSGLLLHVVSNGPDPIPLDVRPDLRVLSFTAALAIATGILFGLAPAFRAARVEVASTLRENSRGVMGGGGRISLGKALVMAQIAISLLLLIGSGLFIRTLRNLENVQLGYSRDKLVLVDVDATSAGYEGANAADLYSRLLAEVRSIPGVKSATYSQNGLFSGSESGTQLYVEGYTPAKAGDTGARFDQVGADYFSSLGIPILRGREIGRQDTGASTPVCVINQTMAKEFFDGRDPLGKHIKDLFPGSKAQFEIVGVSQDVRDHNLRGKIPRRFYVPATQGLPEVAEFVNFEIRSAGSVESVVPAVRSKFQGIDRSLPIGTFSTLDELLSRALLQERIIAQLSTFFGALALILASMGLYGVLSYAVARRTNEIGIRMAIGAAQGRVVWMILRETLVLVAIGAVVGIGASLGLARLVANRMFGVSTGDPVTMAVAALTLTLVAMAAASFPAIRAAKVDPMVALRVE
ncbi:MAG TPA: ABC transporter permease [Bryobacteraceae bacterium]|nr:ABC transporter permease [Bryobacteraceae bacterium]